ncbi:hypothetical protein BKA70DRAFT_667068 [Coprinopsis sp. MPI-PUGE-AT-0042]|nr:hypothetical protein BKA70DRAFT_667068 [Coprinopsis sp. MPI-PUGE-AT-0042]
MCQLLKIPLLLLAGVSNQIATTPPHPPAARSDKVPRSFLEDFLRESGPRFLVYSSWWTAVFVEIAAIVLSNQSQPQTSSLAECLLGRLRFPGGSLSTIRITPSFLSGLAMVCSGALIRWLSYRALGRFFTYELTIKEDHKLVTTGPYAYVRHPGYSAILLVFTGTFLVFASPGSWIWESGFLSTNFGKPFLGTLSVVPLAITGGLLNRMPKEDTILRKEFGGEWDKWARDVPYKLVPYVY